MEEQMEQVYEKIVQIFMQKSKQFFKMNYNPTHKTLAT